MLNKLSSLTFPEVPKNKVLILELLITNNFIVLFYPWIPVVQMLQNVDNFHLSMKVCGFVNRTKMDKNGKSEISGNSSECGQQQQRGNFAALLY